MKLFRRFLPVVLCVTAPAFLPSTAFAQLSIGMAYGGYFPLGGSLIKEYGGLNGAPVPYPVFEKWQTGAVTMALRAAYGITGRLGIALKYTHSPGRVSTRDSTNAVVERPGFMGLLSIRAPYKLTPVGSSTIIQVAPGFAYAKRGGTSWAGIGRTSNPAFVMSVGFGGLLGRRSKWSARIEVEDYFSFVKYNAGRYQPTTRQFHQDLMLSLGVDYSFRRPRRVAGQN